MHRSFGLALAAALVLVEGTAAAEDVAAAEALFNRGLADMLAGKFESGCPALAESHRLDPRPGTLFTLAECEAKAGRYATAVTRYQDYLETFARLAPDKRAKQRGREKDAARAKAELGPLVPTLTLALPSGAPADVVVKRDGVVLGGPSLGVALPVDPGEHVVTTEAPDAAPIEVRVKLGHGEQKRLVLALPERARAAAPVALATPTAPAAPPPDRGSTQRAIGWAFGGLGVAGLLVGGVTGGLTLAKKGTVDAECDAGARLCSHDGKVAVDAAQTTALVSTVGFGVGLGGLAIGTVLLLTAPSRPKPAAASAWSVDVAAPRGGLALGVGRAF